MMDWSCYSDFLKSLGVDSMPQPYGRNFEEVMREYTARGVWFLQDDFLISLQEKYGLFPQKYEFVQASLRAVRENELLARHSLLLYHMLSDRKEGSVVNVEHLPIPPTKDLAPVYEMSAFFSQLAFAPEMIAYLSARAVPADVIHDTMLDCFEGAILNFEMLFGRNGFEADRIFRWNQRYLNYTLLRIGVLCFEMRSHFVDSALVLRNKTGETVILVNSRPISADGYLAGSVGQEKTDWIAELTQTEEYLEGYRADPQAARIVKEKIRLPREAWHVELSAEDPVISVHIPSGVSFSLESIENSYQRCLEILARSFPEYRPKCFYCHSWLMDPQLREMLKPTSNIVAFQSKYLRFAYDSMGVDVFTFLFHMPNAKQLADLPEDTSLQRRVKAHYLDGGYIYEPGGVFFFDAVQQTMKKGE